MKNSVSDRIKITKNGKILRRAMAQSHFRANKRSIQLKRKKGLRGLDGGMKFFKKS